jgi:hypothetical protein
MGVGGVSSASSYTSRWIGNPRCFAALRQLERATNAGSAWPFAAWDAISPDGKQTIMAVVDAELEAANAR